MLTTIIAGAFVLGVVILVHEFGHFIVAKKSGIYVKTFAVGFGKKILRRRFGETEYCICLLPFGGYVKFAGESELYDEAEAAEEDEKPSDEVPDSEIPRERYFTVKPRPIRAAVLFAGPFMNYVLAVVIYVSVTMLQGVLVTPSTVVGELTPGGAADSLGLRSGDEIVAIDGVEVTDWSAIEKPFLDDAASPKEFQVRRGKTDTTITFAARVDKAGIRLGFGPFRSTTIGRVQKSKPAWRAGLRPGAIIEAIDDTVVTSYEDIRRMINEHPGEPLYVQWSLGAQSHADTIVPDAKEVLKAAGSTELITVGVIGIGPEYVRQRLGLVEALDRGFAQANGTIVQIVSYLGQLISGKMGVKTLGGPILITQMAGDVANWGFDYLLLFLAFFSINLCVFNLLPILPFDGGHLTILAIEGIQRRSINRRVREWLTQGGFILIILLMAFVLMLDLSRCSGASLF